ncbi:MAG: transcriptional regulator [ANME-2 cluster archaeon]|nr:transcriptional regulator [ANME-2 cluster archaeon]MBC2702149.1 transcriptional regulator [ANME-2 cluster archaeon]MBC2708689.1 transcriptional regulator [ANME-2 cluster archaeon]MBC2745395.1 transcriptional regulator [ANME-2 cluster archaeon]MBC2762363.1 transcriptional regulator [ANME-2 cluster archaeon]
MDELIGFVSSNDKRDRIMGILGHHGTLDRELIAKRARMIPLTTGKILEELQEKGLVEEKEGLFSLTLIGNEVENKMKGLR